MLRRFFDLVLLLRSADYHIALGQRESVKTILQDPRGTPHCQVIVRSLSGLLNHRDVAREENTLVGGYSIKLGAVSTLSQPKKKPSRGQHLIIPKDAQDDTPRRTKFRAFLGHPTLLGARQKKFLSSYGHEELNQYLTRHTAWKTTGSRQTRPTLLLCA